MSTQILIKRSTTTGAVPTTSDIAVGELAINTVDKRIFTNNSGTIVELGTTPTTQAVTGNASVGGTFDVVGAVTVGNFTADGTVDLTSATVTIPAPTADTHPATKKYVDDEVNAILDGAPAALDTLNEIAAAINDDANLYTTLTDSIATKLSLSGGTMTGSIDMGANGITTSADPATANTLTRKSYVDGLYQSTVDAEVSATAAAASAASAANSASSASTSASTATTQASAASTSATNAASSATAAASSATSASNSASAAATSASAASTSAANAEAAYDSFDDRYLGQKSSAPTQDNDGNALLTGAMYFNSTDDNMYVYTGSAWATVSNTASADAAASSASAASTSASAAATSATSAATSASQASSSATSASSSASSASTSATNAANSATSAAASETSAEGHKDLAYTYWQNAASAVAYQDLAAIAASKAVTAVDVFVYDTSKDSDGGAWRKRTQHTSWYNEPLNTATRGARKEFPAVAVIVAESNKVTIYDGDDPSLPMWMVYPAAVVNSCYMLNGVLYVGRTSSLRELDFIKDSHAYYTTAGKVVDANPVSLAKISNTWGSPDSSLAIVNAAVNDVAMTVLPNAPIDPATQLPIPTIAVATDGGVSVIKDDGSVVDSLFTGSVNSLSFTSEYGLFYWRETDRLCYFSTLSDYLAGDGFGDGWYVNADHANAYLTINPLGGNPQKVIGLPDLHVAFGGHNGISKVATDESDKNTGMVSYITSDYNTGWMHGDIKGAFLSDTTAETVGVDESTELVTNGTFDSDLSGWTIGSSAWEHNGSGAIHKTGATAGSFQQSLSGVSNGDTVVVSFDVTSNTSSHGFNISGSSEFTPSAFQAVGAGVTGSFSFTLKATADNPIIDFYHGSSSDIVIDNISVKQTGNLVVNGTFDVNTSGWTADTAADLSVVSGAMRVENNANDLGFAYQAITLEANKPYVFVADIVNVNGVQAQFSLHSAADPIANKLAGETNYQVGTHSFTYTPSSSGTYYLVACHRGSNTAGYYIDVDNISVRLAEEDRSVNNNGLEVHGEVVKASVAAGSDLVAYSGFSADNYLEQPYNSDLDFGTGDFYVMGWVKPTYNAIETAFERIDSSVGSTRKLIEYRSDNKFRLMDGAYVDSSNTYPLSTWHFVCGIRASGTTTLWVNGVAQGSFTSTGGADTGNERLIIGNRIVGTNKSGPLALWRIGAGAPTAEQIAKIYEDEKVLFQEGAQATLYGTSDAVTALAYDDSTELLHVGTSSGRSEFSGLRRVSNTTDAVGTAISASNGMVVEE